MHSSFQTDAAVNPCHGNSGGALINTKGLNWLGVKYASFSRSGAFNGIGFLPFQPQRWSSAS